MRLHPYTLGPLCIKCGTFNLDLPVFHPAGPRRWYRSSWIWFVQRCSGFLLDHLHMHCRMCGASWEMACADVKEESTWR